MNEAEEMKIKFFVTGADAAKAFGSLKEIFDAMTATIMSAMK